MKKTSYQRLKDKLKESQAETAKVRDDFKKSLNGNFMVTETWRMQFKMEEDFENTIWNGKPTEL